MCDKLKTKQKKTRYYYLEFGMLFIRKDVIITNEYTFIK